MRVCVVGCGAIGSLFAARLAEHAEVWAYDVSAPHVDAINRDGLRIQPKGDSPLYVHDEAAGRRGPRVQPKGDSPLYVRARTDAGEIPACELGLVATKAPHTEAAIAATAHVFADGAVCSVQNGIGSEEVLARHVPRVIRGVTLLAGHVVAPGIVHEDAPGTTWLGPFEPQPARDEEIRALAELIGAVALPDSRGAQWTKLLFNAATNPLAALTGLTHGELCAQPKLRATVTALVDEGRAVAGALGIALDSDPDALITRAAEENFAHRPSMLQDVLARRPTEIDALNGGIVHAGKAVGVPTPLHATIAALIAGLEAGWNNKD